MEEMKVTDADREAAKSIRVSKFSGRLSGCCCHSPYVPTCVNCEAIAKAIAQAREEGRKQGLQEGERIGYERGKKAEWERHNKIVWNVPD